MRKFYLLAFIFLIGFFPKIFGQVILVDTQRVLISQKVVPGFNSSLLEVWAKNKGLLIPRSDFATINSINDPAKGLLLNDTVNNYIWEFNGTGWEIINEKWLLNAGNIYTNSKVCFGCSTPIMKLETGGNISINNGKSYKINGTDVLHEKGTGNLALGLNANSNDSSGSYNTSLGEEAGKFLTTGINNTLIGYQSGLSSSSSQDNSYIGYRSGYNNTVGNNVFIGSESGYYNTGSANVLSGYQAGYGANGQSTADTNVAVGFKAGYSMTTARFNSIGGNEAAFSLLSGTKNVIFGRRSGYSLTSGDGNVFVGDSAGFSMTTSDSSVFVGAKAGLRCVASLSVAIGDSALAGLLGTNVTGEKNVCFGHASGARLSTGELNVFGGYKSGFKGNSTNNCVFLGDFAGFNSTSGDENVYLGYMAGYNSNASGNIFIGNQAGYNETSANLLYVENSNASSSNALICGDFNADSLKLNSDVTIRDFLNLRKDSATLSLYQSLSPTTSYMKLLAQSSLTLDTVNAIVNGVYKGQVLVLEGSDNSNTLTMRNNANTNLNSQTIVLGRRDRLMLIWDGNNWVQISFSNN